MKAKTENDTKSQALLSWLNRSLKPPGLILRLEDTLVSLHAVSICASAVVGSINISVATLKSTVVDDGAVVNGHLRSDIILSITTIKTVGWDKNVEEARGKECTDDENDNHVHKNKAVDERGVIGVVVEELGIGKGEHESHSWACNILETNWPYPMDLPVRLAPENGVVEIATDLVALV